MISKVRYVGGAAAVAGVLILAGCGSSQSSPAVAAKLLSNANTTALATSFKAQFQGTLHLTTTGVTGLPTASAAQLQQVQSELNSATVRGTIEYQGPKTFEVTYSFPPVLSQPLEVIDVAGAEYASIDGTHWHAVSTSSVGGGQLPSQFANLPSQLKTLGLNAKGATTITNLGSTTLNGVAVDHVRAVVSATGLDRIFSGALSTLGSGSGSSSLGAEATILAQLIHFDSAQADTYISTSTNLPEQESASGGMSFNLAALSLLSGGQDAHIAGTVAFGFGFTVSYGDYGAHFSIAKPGDVVAGPLPTPKLGISALS